MKSSSFLKIVIELLHDPFGNREARRYEYLCRSGSFTELQDFLSSLHSRQERLLNNHIEKGLKIIIERQYFNGKSQLEHVALLLSQPFLQDKPSPALCQVLNQYLDKSCHQNDTLAVKYLVEKCKFAPFLNMQEHNYRGFTCAYLHCNKEMLDLLLDNELVAQEQLHQAFVSMLHIHLIKKSHGRKRIFHMMAYAQQHLPTIPDGAPINKGSHLQEMMNYLILQRNIPLTPSLKENLQKDAPDILQLFDRRELHQALDNHLEVKEHTPRKRKI